MRKINFSNKQLDIMAKMKKDNFSDLEISKIVWVSEYVIRNHTRHFWIKVKPWRKSKKLINNT